METLLDLYLNVDKAVWDYYSEINPNVKALNPFVENPNLAECHQQFIRDYFRLAGKTDVLKQFATFDILSDDRAMHTNSVFFLGVLIRENTIFKTHLFYEKRSKLNYPIFPFLWFLSVLFHDFGMKNELDPKILDEVNGLEDLYRKYDVNHFILNEMPKNIPMNLFAEIERYFNYRRSHNKVDHGILAGIYLFDRLVKIRKYKRSHQDDELSWHPSLDKKYALAATAIACHNIWTIAPNNPDCESYVNAGLDYLIQPSFEAISVSSFPLLCLFGIVDTIDPIKLYMRDGFEPKTILENLEMSFFKREVTVRNRPDSPLSFKKLVKQANGLIGWIAVNVTATDNSLVIKFL